MKLFEHKIEGPEEEPGFEPSSNQAPEAALSCPCLALVLISYPSGSLGHTLSLFVPAADNENNIASNQSRSPPAVVEEKWKPQAQRNSTNNSRSPPDVAPKDSS